MKKILLLTCLINIIIIIYSAINNFKIEPISAIGGWVVAIMGWVQFD